MNKAARIALGGGTAVNFAAQYPEKIKNLILISPVICDFKISKIFKIPILGEFIARIAGVRVIVKRFKSLFKNNIEFKPVDDAGHGIVFQKSEVVNKLILDFL